MPEKGAKCKIGVNARETELKKLSLRMAGAALAAMSVSVPAAAQMQPMSDAWQYGATLYVWLPDIGGKTTFPAGTGSSISVDASEIIDSLKFTFMGTFEAGRDAGRSPMSST
jgi:hypothetical protein